VAWRFGGGVVAEDLPAGGLEVEEKKKQGQGQSKKQEQSKKLKASGKQEARAKQEARSKGKGKGEESRAGAAAYRGSRIECLHAGSGWEWAFGDEGGARGVFAGLSG